MKYGLLRYSYSNNIGDEIQTIAAQRFLPKVDLSVERDRLHWYRNLGALTVPFNGWFTRPAFPACWPPPDNVKPIFVSWYAVTPDALINQCTAAYFKRFEPIGCRSIATIRHFEDVGVEAYHSGCLTLTLPKRPRERTDEICIVDVESSLLAAVVPAHVRSKAKFLSHLTATGQISSGTGWSACDFYLTVMNRIDRHMRFLKGHRERLMQRRHTRRMTMANARLETYANAKLVITGLLHCAMPCLALGTPVVLLKPGLAANPRFAGLRELVGYRSSGTEKVSINWDRPQSNPEDYQVLSCQLERRMRDILGGSK